MAGAIPAGAPRYVTSDSDGVLSEFVTQHLVPRAELVAITPITKSFTASTVWVFNLPTSWPRLPDVTLIRADGAVISTTTNVTNAGATAIFSEPVAGNMILR